VAGPEGPRQSLPAEGKRVERFRFVIQAIRLALVQHQTAILAKTLSNLVLGGHPMRLGMCCLVLVAATAGCVGPFHKAAPPAERLMHPGPGVGGPGPGVMSYQPAVPMPSQTSQVAFVGPEGMLLTWDVGMPGAFNSEPLICPGRNNFPQAAVYRLKLTNIPGPGREGMELYPTLEVGPSMPRTRAFLAHNAVPVQFTEEDFDQVLSGNFVTKVIYLPDPEFQPIALAGVETLVSTRLDPGVDPIVEADKQGSILAIVRLGNLDLQMPGDMVPGMEVVPAAYGMQLPYQQMPCEPGIPMGGPAAAAGTTTPVNYISGLNGPEYGMPMCGTPIGLPGPPHVPFGAPAGLQRHVMKNHTKTHIPAPTSQMRIDVRQDPGIGYPAPPNRAWIVEKASTRGFPFVRPLGDRRETIMAGDPGCPTGDPSGCASGCGSTGCDSSCGSTY
jgi:hypothetical protein